MVHLCSRVADPVGVDLDPNPTNKKKADPNSDPTFMNFTLSNKANKVESIEVYADLTLLKRSSVL